MSPGGRLSLQAALQGMTRREEQALRRAVAVLEGKSFVARLTDLTGQPLSELLCRLPKPVSVPINRAVRRALSRALDVALFKMSSRGEVEPSAAAFQIASGVTGGVSGFFGIGALALELPLTTTLMLRSIAGIAARHGEQLHKPESRLACLEVFALGPHGKDGISGETSYYAARAFLAKTVSEAAQSLLERGAAGTSAPAIVEAITAIGSRFGVVVSEKVAAGAIPVVGALGGAAVNVAFMQHFQQMARAHFTVRHLERRHGSRLIQSRYQVYAQLRKGPLRRQL